jgi:Type I restriction-modification system methyltransferase subunit
MVMTCRLPLMPIMLGFSIWWANSHPMAWLVSFLPMAHWVPMEQRGRSAVRWLNADWWKRLLYCLETFFTLPIYLSHFGFLMQTKRHVSSTVMERRYTIATAKRRYFS